MQNIKMLLNKRNRNLGQQIFEGGLFMSTAEETQIPLNWIQPFTDKG